MNFLNKKTFTKRGFTLIEMLIVIVIIGVLASALIPRLGSARGKANDVARKADLQQLATAIISYQIDANKFPATKQKVVASGGIAVDLIKGGMASIPVGDETTFTGLDNVLSSGYIYYPMEKNGGNGNGFLLMGRAETEGGANFVKCITPVATAIAVDGSEKIDNIKLCVPTVNSAATSCDPVTCVAKDKSELRYIYKY